MLIKKSYNGEIKSFQDQSKRLYMLINHIMSKKIVERPYEKKVYVDRPVVVEKYVDQPYAVEKIVTVEKPFIQEKIVEKVIEKNII